MLKKFFNNSETILWARAQMLIGASLTVLEVTDIAPVVSALGLGHWSPVAVLAMGIITEVARRRRATDL